jgi:predicted metal-dependent peptidase
MRKPDHAAEATMRALLQRRVDLILQRPFFGALCMKLAVTIDRKHDAVGWTDGKRLGIHPERFLDLDIAQQTALIAHEVMHCAMGHPWRQGPRELELWNDACDHAVNLTLRKAGMSIPDNWVLDERYAGMSAEVIYSRLLNDRPPQAPEGGEGQDDPQDGDEGQDGAGNPPPDSPDGAGEGNAGGAIEGEDDESPAPGPGDASNDLSKDAFDEKPTTFGGGPGGVRAPEPGDEGDDVSRGTAGADEARADWQAATEAAAMVAAQQGEGAGWLQYVIDQARKPKVDWTAETRRFMQQIASTDYSWRVPNRRYVARGLIMPALSEPQMGLMVVVRDTSGSCASEAGQFTAEVQAIIEEVKPERVMVIDADWIVQRVWELERGDGMPESMEKSHGGGGTSFVPPFDLIEKVGEQPACMVYLTDLYGNFPKVAPDYPVLWVSTSDERRVPFGEVVPMN